METAKIVKAKLYKDAAGEWRAQLFSSNGNMVFTSSEGYKNHLDALGAVTTNFPDATLDDEVET